MTRTLQPSISRMSLRTASGALSLAAVLLLATFQSAQAQTFTVLYNFAEPPDGAHPFVLPGFAAGVRYTDSEARRIAAARAAKGFSMYEELRIREAAGDRLLFVADVPDVLWREPESPAV